MNELIKRIENPYLKVRRGRLPVGVSWIKVNELETLTKLSGFKYVKE